MNPYRAEVHGMSVQGMGGYAMRAGMHMDEYARGAAEGVCGAVHGELCSEVCEQLPGQVLCEHFGMSGTGVARADSVAEPSPAERLAASAIHRLCQPLTALQCTLELGLDRGEDAASLRDAMADSLRECVRTIAMLNVFRDLSELPSRYGAVVETDIAAVIKTLGLRIACSGRACDTHVMAAPAGLEVIFRNIRQVLKSCGGDAQGCAHLQREQAEGQTSSNEEQPGWLLIRWNIADTDNDAPRLQREAKLMHPFSVADFDFRFGGLPPLAVASTLAEAMGGMLVASECSLELRLLLAGQSRYGWHAAEAENVPPRRTSMI